MAAALLGFLAVLAATQGRLPDRGQRRLELVDLIREQGGRVDSLGRSLSRLQGRLDLLTVGTATQGSATGELGKRVRALSAWGGTAGLSGPGVTVTLDDSSSGRSPTGDPNDLIVHEQDIQAVVNALWSAGAEAMAVNGERLTAVSAVRCAGNTLLLHGKVHSPPYRIAAIGDPVRLEARLSRQPGMGRLLAAVSSFGLGFEVRAGDVRIREGRSVPRLRSAEPA